MRDREVCEIRIRFTGGHVVVTIVATRREVGGAHGLAQKTDADATARTEELLHQCGLLRSAELVPNQPGGRIGEGTAKSIHLLILGCVVDGDDETAGIFAGAVAKETLGWVCSSIVRSPVVSTICTLGPSVVCAVPVERGQLARKRQVVHRNESWKNLPILR